MCKLVMCGSCRCSGSDGGGGIYQINSLTYITYCLNNYFVSILSFFHYVSYLGKIVRDLALFYKIFLIDRIAKKATQLCPLVKSGVMHREFQKYLSPDGMGIDYSYLEDFDTSAELKRSPP